MGLLRTTSSQGSCSTLLRRVFHASEQIDGEGSLAVAQQERSSRKGGLLPAPWRRRLGRDRQRRCPTPIPGIFGRSASAGSWPTLASTPQVVLPDEDRALRVLAGTAVRLRSPCACARRLAHRGASAIAVAAARPGPVTRSRCRRRWPHRPTGARLTESAQPTAASLPTAHPQGRFAVALEQFLEAIAQVPDARHELLAPRRAGLCRSLPPFPARRLAVLTLRAFRGCGALRPGPAALLGGKQRCQGQCQHDDRRGDPHHGRLRRWLRRWHPADRSACAAAWRAGTRRPARPHRGTRPARRNVARRGHPRPTIGGHRGRAATTAEP